MQARNYASEGSPEVKTRCISGSTKRVVTSQKKNLSPIKFYGKNEREIIFVRILIQCEQSFRHKFSLIIAPAQLEKYFFKSPSKSGSSFMFHVNQGR